MRPGVSMASYSLVQRPDLILAIWIHISRVYLSSSFTGAQSISKDFPRQCSLSPLIIPGPGPCLCALLQWRRRRP